MLLWLYNPGQSLLEVDSDGHILEYVGEGEAKLMGISEYVKVREKSIRTQIVSRPADVIGRCSMQPRRRPSLHNFSSFSQIHVLQRVVTMRGLLIPYQRYQRGIVWLTAV